VRAVRWVLVVTVLLAAVWGAVMWQWQRSGRQVSDADLLLYLVVLPLAVLLAVVLLRGAWRRSAVVTAGAAAAAASAAAPAADASAAVAPVTAPAWYTLSGYGVVAAGLDDISQLLEQAAQPPALRLDPDLRDDDGLGVFTRRCTQADVVSDDNAAPLARAMRAAMLAQASAESLLQRLAELHEVLPVEPAPEIEPASGHPTLVMPQARAAAPARPSLRVLHALPDTWRDDERADFTGRMTTWWEQVSPTMPGWQWHRETIAVPSGERALQQAERRLQLIQREGLDEHLVLVVADSWIDEAMVQQLLAQGLLLTAQQPQGWVPGEAGVALLLSPARAAGAQTGGVRLHRLSLQRRDKSVDEPGRVSGDTLADTIDQLLRAAGHAAESVDQVISDTDLSRNRTTELFEALQRALPSPQVAEHCHCLGRLTGRLGIAAAPLALAAAAAHCQREQQAVVAVTNSHPHDRLAALLAPAPTPDPASAAATAAPATGS